MIRAQNVYCILYSNYVCIYIYINVAISINIYFKKCIIYYVLIDKRNP